MSVRRTLEDGLPAAGDGGGTLLPGEAVGAGQVPGVNDGVGIEVSGGTPPGLAWDKLGISVVGHPTHPIHHTIQVILSVGSRVCGIPCGGIWGGGVNAHEPPDSIRAPPQAGHDSYYVGR